MEAKPSFIFKLNKADLLIAVGRELEIGWLPPLDHPGPQREDPARRRGLPRRFAHREDPRHPDRARSRAPWATSIPRATRTTGSIPTTAGASRQAIEKKLSAMDPANAAYFAQREDDFDRRLTAAEKRWDGPMAPYKGIEGRHLPPLLAQLRRPLRPRRDRLRGAAARHPAVAVAHARPHQGDEGAGRQDHPRRALLRPQDAELHRAGDRGQGAGAAALGGRREGGHRLHQALRLRRRACSSTPSRRRERSRWTSTILQFLAAPFAASLILTGIHAYLGVHVVERGVIFVDLSLAQIAALGGDHRHPAPLHGRRSARALGLLDQPRLHLRRRRHLLHHPRQARAHPPGGDHRHLLRGGLRRVHPGHEQGHLGERAPQGHAGRQHPGRVLGGGAQDGRPLRGRGGRSTTCSGGSSSPSRWRTASATATRRSPPQRPLWDFLFYASFGFVVTSSVAIAGVLLVFCYLIVPSVAAMLYSEHIGRRLAIGWTMGTVVSALGHLPLGEARPADGRDHGLHVRAGAHPDGGGAACLQSQGGNSLTITGAGSSPLKPPVAQRRRYAAPPRSLAHRRISRRAGARLLPRSRGTT